MYRMNRQMQCFCGNILSVSAGNEVFRYLVEHNGKIEYVGNQLPEQYRSARRVEQLYLSGRPYESCRENVLRAALRGLTSGAKA